MLDAIILADLHFGAIEISKFEHELDRCLFDRINHMRKLDAIFIAGDLFDMKEYSTSIVFKAVISFLKRLLNMTEKLGTRIVAIKGTRTHDDYQLQTLELIFKGIDRIRFVHTICDDTIDDVSILYVPEEYVLDQDEYYSEWFSKHYDIMIGHGTIDSIWRSKKQKRDDITSAPVFNVDKLCSVANYCYFGHEHMNKEYGDKKRFKYVGPMTVWEYDKPVSGYYIIHYSPETTLCREEYIHNEYAQKLVEQTIHVGDSVYMEDIQRIIEDAIGMDGYDGIKFKIDANETCPIIAQLKAYLTAKVGLYPNIKLDFKTISAEEETEEERVERQKTEELHSTIFEGNLPDESVISEFIKSKNGKDISLDRIKEYCGIGDLTNG